MGNLISYLMLVFSLLLLTLQSQGVLAVIEYVPANTSVEHRRVDTVVVAATDSGSRRMLDPFQLCLDCRCCAANDQSNCSVMPCCFGIDCNLPEKPFGVCAFVPKACNCTSCQ